MTGLHNYGSVRSDLNRILESEWKSRGALVSKKKLLRLEPRQENQQVQD